MSFRVHRSPDDTGGAGGGVEEAKATTVTMPLEGINPPAKEVVREVVKTPKIEVDPVLFGKQAEELSLLKAQLAEFQKERQAAIEAERQKYLGELAAKEGASKALDEQLRLLKEEQEKRQKSFEEALTKAQAEAEARIREAKEHAAKLERDYLDEKKANFIADQMAGRQWVNAHAERDAREKLARKVTVERGDNGQLIYRGPDGKFASESIPSLLDSDEFEHLQRPKSTGGAGVQSGAAREVAAPSGSSDDPIANLFKAARDAMSVRSDAIGFR